MLAVGKSIKWSLEVSPNYLLKEALHWGSSVPSGSIPVCSSIAYQETAGLRYGLLLPNGPTVSGTLSAGLNNNVCCVEYNGVPNNPDATLSAWLDTLHPHVVVCQSSSFAGARSTLTQEPWSNPGLLCFGKQNHGSFPCRFAIFPWFA